MKIYTRKGDKGETGLLGGARVPKNHIRIEAYGTIDELNSYIGLLRDQQPEAWLLKELIEVQDRLFVIGSHLALEPGKTNIKLPGVNATDVEALEKSIDAMNERLPEMKNFVLPGGHPAVSIAHICRCVCRRAERLVVSLAEESEVEEIVLIYLNRLSDYLFVVSRELTRFFGVPETPWIPRM